MNPFEYIKQRITDIADVNVAINGRDPSWGYSDLMELLTNIEEAYNDRYGSSDTISRQAAIDIFDDYNVSVENGELEAYSRDRKRLCELPSAQPEQEILSWLLAYHTKSFELHGRYMPHEVIGWLVHDFANAYMAERREG